MINRGVMVCGLLGGLLMLLIVLPVLAQSPDWAAEARHLRLVDDLDRPEDGYCLDVLGSGRHIRFDMPLTAHNCKPGLYADEAVVFSGQGEIRFPAYGGCVTATGVNGRSLPGAALMLKECGVDSPFLVAGPLQQFRHRDDNRIELTGTGLCVAVGAVSDSTFDPSHRWRSLFMARCDDVPLGRSAWRMANPSA